MMQTRDSSAADRLTELDPKGFAGLGTENSLQVYRENAKLDFTGMLIRLHRHLNKVHFYQIYIAKDPMMAAQELVCFNINNEIVNHFMYLTCPVAKIKSTTVEGPQPGHGLKSVCEAPFSSAQSDIRHKETLLHSRLGHIVSSNVKGAVQTL